MSIDVNKMKINKQPSIRFIELDIIRGIAIALMIFLHLLWDLDYFGIVPLNHQIYQFQEVVPLVFFLLVGICLVVGKNKNLSKTPQEQKKYDRHLALRGLKIFGFGMAITIATIIFMPDRPIIFGVLHFIGLSIILSIPFIKLKSYNILFASLMLLAGIIIGKYPIENPTVFHLVIGLHQANIWSYTIDYFPLLPWFGVTLIGIVAGDILYKDNKRRFYLPDLPKYKPFTTLSWVGKHSLVIYLLHQPVIAGMLFIFVLI
jgi:uncharacterized membrane protein